MKRVLYGMFFCLQAISASQVGQDRVKNRKDNYLIDQEENYFAGLHYLSKNKNKKRKNTNKKKSGEVTNKFISAEESKGICKRTSGGETNIKTSYRNKAKKLKTNILKNERYDKYSDH